VAAKLQFKFSDDASGNDRERLIANLEDRGVEKVEPLFPDESDEELAALYSALVSTDADFKKVLRLLKRSSKVEFAEPEVDRHLIAPTEIKRQSASRRR
jgi:hypothetical protein